MRSAPAVTVQLPGSRRWNAAVAGLGALAAGALSATALAHAGAPVLPTGLCIAAMAGLGAALAWRTRAPSRGRLRWDGAAWWWLADRPAAAETSGSLHVMIDLGRWMLLRFDDESGRARAWLPVSPSRVRNQGALRAAVYCRALSPATSARRARDPE